MLALIIGVLLIVGALVFGLLTIGAVGMDPQARPMSETVGRWPLYVSLGAILLGIVILVWG